MRSVLMTILLVALAACGGDDKRAKTQYGEFGLDLTVIDPETSAGDDFYRHVNGKWLDSFEIPADRSRYGVFTALLETSERQVRAIIEESAASEPKHGSIEKKIADYYNAFMNAEEIERQGLDPVKDMIQHISEAETREDLSILFGKIGYMSPVSGWVDIDSKNPNRNIFYFTQSGLGLPDRSYYLEDTEFFRDIRVKYKRFLTKMLRAVGNSTPTLAARRVLELETKMARAHWEPAKRRERDLTYNLYTRDELIELGGDFPVEAMLKEMYLLRANEFIVREPDAVAEMFAVAQSYDLQVWKDYLTAHLLSQHASVLPRRIDEAHFNFYRKALTGQQEMRDRWKRGVAAVEEALGEAIGSIYVTRHFPPEARARIDELVANLGVAFEQRLDGLEWMGDATRAEARDKLDRFVAKIGHPDEFESYKDMRLSLVRPFRNLIEAHGWAYFDMIKKLNEPVDRTEWFMTPQTVNAYYSPNRNEIVFPAAILQPPFFDPNADAAVNYGAIGAVIGHEMGHGFDDQGSKSDGDGRLRNWWTDEDREAFNSRTAGLVEQYNAYSPIGDQFVNGQLTLGENIGDLGGLTMAYDAYRLSLNGEEAPVLGGLTGDQRFFMSWAQVWRALYREAATLRQLKSDPHSPPQYRVNGVVRNMDAWYRSFDVGPDNAMYLAPDKRIGVW